MPSLVGFDVPDAQAVVQSRMVDEPMSLEIARQWASLLIGSLLVYGIVPRAIAWAFCAAMFHRSKMQINFKLPYYQKIISFWQRQVVDADDFEEVVQPVAPPAKVIKGKKAVVLLEYPHQDPNWYQFAAGHNIEDFGVITEREDLSTLLEYLEKNDVQALVGIHLQSLPDRGLLRQLDKIASTAKQGLVVQLLSSENPSEDLTVRQQQWQAALAQRQIGMVQL